ncbi:MAG: hypothetical protein OEL85_00780 [Desulfobulbaceae bacterium]|nr:hypothetical protein [Desulfobulbaceae bacterium]
MKVEIIFLTAVLGIAAIHLGFSLVNFLAGFNRRSIQESDKKKERADWYVFFDKSSLYGDIGNTAMEPEGSSINDVESNPACEDACQPLEAYT